MELPERGLNLKQSRRGATGSHRLKELSQQLPCTKPNLSLQRHNLPMQQIPVTSSKPQSHHKMRKQVRRE
ncbi:hypothetical protein ACOSQ2_028640 [Xanthoceras sorbifolium]